MNNDQPRAAIGLMRKLHMEPDPWQAEVLQEDYHHLLLNCCRQAGKSTVVAMLGLTQALFNHGSLILLVSRSLRQAKELFRIVKDFHFRLGEPFKERANAAELQLENTSRVVCLPCSETTIRGYSKVALLVIDEAATVPDDLYRAVRPMLAVSAGRMICLSTPRGKRGFFYHSWAQGGDDWKRIEVAADKIPRIKPAFLDQERRAMGESWFRQEFCCSFEALEGLVYPDLHKCVVPGPAPQLKRRHGGIDFGYRNPFAAVWGGLDGDGVLWLTAEHYEREQPLSYHAALLPRDVSWVADPSGAGDRAELRCAGFLVNLGKNAIRQGIAAVQARIRAGTLRILEGACPNLLAEAGLYRWDDAPNDSASEQPRDGYDHALDALRYLVHNLDKHHLARPAGPKPPPPIRPSPNAPRPISGHAFATTAGGFPSADHACVSRSRPRIDHIDTKEQPQMTNDPIRNRIKSHRKVRAGDLVPHEWNFRFHPGNQRAALHASYREVGFARSLLAFELPDGRLKLIDGHLRRDLDPDMEVDVEILDVTEEEARKLLLTIDPLAVLAHTQEEIHERLQEITPIDDVDLQAVWQAQAQRFIDKNRHAPVNGLGQLGIALGPEDRARPRIRIDEGDVLWRAILERVGFLGQVSWQDQRANAAAVQLGKDVRPVELRSLARFLPGHSVASLGRALCCGYLVILPQKRRTAIQFTSWRQAVNPHEP